MSAEIIPLPGLSGASSIAHFVRVGEQSHHQLEDLHAQGCFPIKRVVLDASRFKHQLKFFQTLKADAVELVLDTKAAELAEPGKCKGYAKGAPWANPDDQQPLSVRLFEKGGNGILDKIAEFAVQHGFSAVLSPAHYLRQGANDEWFRIDLDSCETLRKKLDNLGGKNIAIDYPVIIPHTLLRDEAVRGALAHGLSGVPFENLWFRGSGFGSDATASGARGFINAMSGFHNLGRPIVADYLGGLVGIAGVAFGAISGFAHGVGERERFDAGTWHLEPKQTEDAEKGKGGRVNRIYVASIDRSLTVAELRALAKARGGRGLVVCDDRSCCSGLEDMISNWRRHFILQRVKQVQRLESVPDLRRVDDFLSHDLALANQQSRQIKKLTPVETELAPKKSETPAEAKARLLKRLSDLARRDEKLLSTLEDLHKTRGSNVPRAKSAKFRGASNRETQDIQKKY